MPRLLLSLAAFMAVLSVDVRPVQAQVGHAPWCAVVSLGEGAIYWDCRYRTIEECVPNVLAGNRGFCNHNPYWEPPAVRPRAHHRKRHAHGH